MSKLSQPLLSINVIDVRFHQDNNDSTIQANPLGETKLRTNAFENLMLRWRLSNVFVLVKHMMVTTTKFVVPWWYPLYFTSSLLFVPIVIDDLLKCLEWSKSNAVAGGDINLFPRWRITTRPWFRLDGGETSKVGNSNTIILRNRLIINTCEWKCACHEMIFDARQVGVLCIGGGGGMQTWAYMERINVTPCLPC